MNQIRRHWGKIFLLLLIIVVVSVVTTIWLIPKNVLSPVIPKTNKLSLNNENSSKKVIVEQKTVEKLIVVTPPMFNKSLYSTTDPTSIWIVTNKQHPLVPINFTPIDLVNSVGATISTKALTDFDTMNNAALAAGVNFTIVSSYRSYDTQNYLYNNYVASYGQAVSDTFSARPGYSEHQTGLAIDLGSSTGAVCNLDDCFGSTIEGAWLAQHAYEYGFLLRYPSDKQQITGYKSEPWHFRYIGKALALEMKNSSISTLEEYFSISGGEVYI